MNFPVFQNKWVSFRAHLAPISVSCGGSYPGIKQAGCAVDYPPPYSFKVQNRWYQLLLRHDVMSQCLIKSGDNFIFTFTLPAQGVSLHLVRECTLNLLIITHKLKRVALYHRILVPCNYGKQFFVCRMHNFVQRYIRFWPCDLLLLQFMNTITEICATLLLKNMMLLSPMFFLRYNHSGNIVSHD